jgi:hypothetical protein
MTVEMEFCLETSLSLSVVLQLFDRIGIRSLGSVPSDVQPNSLIRAVEVSTMQQIQCTENTLRQLQFLTISLMRLLN